MEVSHTVGGRASAGRQSIYLLLSLHLKVYARALVDRGAMDQETVHRLFPGLDELLDVQRNFLLDCEEQYMLPWEEQRWGLCFTENVCRC